MIYYNPHKEIETEKIDKTKDIIPKIYIDINTLSKIQKIIELSPLEVSWFSRVFKTDNNYHIQDAYIIEQVVNPAETEMTLEGLSAYMTDIISKHGIDYYNSIRCWGHSHVNMSTNPSGQDVSQMKEFNSQDFYIMLIANKHGEFTIRLYDFVNNTIWKNLPLHLESTVQDEKEIRRELEEKVKKRTPKPPMYYPYAICDPNHYSPVINKQPDVTTHEYINDLPRSANCFISVKTDKFGNKYQEWINPATNTAWRHIIKSKNKNTETASNIKYLSLDLTAPPISTIIKGFLTKSELSDAINGLVKRYPTDCLFSLEEMLEMTDIEFEHYINEQLEVIDQEFALYIASIRSDEYLADTLYDSFDIDEWIIGIANDEIVEEQELARLYKIYGSFVDEGIESVKTSFQRKDK